MIAEHCSIIYQTTSTKMPAPTASQEIQNFMQALDEN